MADGTESPEACAESTKPSPPASSRKKSMHMHGAQVLAAVRLQAWYRGKRVRRQMKVAQIVTLRERRLHLLSRRPEDETLFQLLERHAELCALKFLASDAHRTNRTMSSGSSINSVALLIEREERHALRQEQTSRRLAKAAWDACDAQGVYEPQELLDMLVSGRQLKGFPDGVANSCVQEFSTEQDRLQMAAEATAQFNYLRSGARSCIARWMEAFRTLVGSVESMET